MAERTVGDVLFAYKRATVSDPVMNNHDQAIPGDAGFLSGAGCGLGRQFTPTGVAIPEPHRNGTPAFILDEEPVVAPDLRVDWPNGRIEFVEVKTRDYPMRRDGALWIGYHDHQIQSYQRLALAGISLSLIVVVYGQQVARHRNPKVQFAENLWGVWKIPASALTNDQLRTGMGRDGSHDQFFRLRDQWQMTDQAAALINTYDYRARSAGIDLLKRIEGTTRAGR